MGAATALACETPIWDKYLPPSPSLWYTGDTHLLGYVGPGRTPPDIPRKPHPPSSALSIQHITLPAEQTAQTQEGRLFTSEHVPRADQRQRDEHRACLSRLLRFVIQPLQYISCPFISYRINQNGQILTVMKHCQNCVLGMLPNTRQKVVDPCPILT